LLLTNEYSFLDADFADYAIQNTSTQPPQPPQKPQLSVLIYFFTALSVFL
jgi:hypothetical protein